MSNAREVAAARPPSALPRWKRLGVAVLVLSLAVTASFVAGASRTAHAAVTFLVVNQPDRVLLGASADGRYVLSRDYSLLDPIVVDRIDGTSTRPAVGRTNASAHVLSGDGQIIGFLTDESLVPSDTDDLQDVYSVGVFTDSLRLMTPGAAGWGFSDIGGIDFGGGRIVARGENGQFARTAGFLADGSSTDELGVAGGVSGSNGSVAGISADGRVILFTTNGGCSGFNCNPMNMYIEDRTDPAAVVTRLAARAQSDGSLISAANAVLSADGRWILLMQSDTGTIFRGRTSSGNTMVPVATPTEKPSFDSTWLSITSDGGAFTWMQKAPLMIADGSVLSGDQVYLFDGTRIVVASNPDVGLPNGYANAGMITDDGSAVLINTLATNLAPVDGPGRSILIRTPSGSPPATNVPIQGPRLDAGSISSVSTPAPPGATAVLVNLTMVDGAVPGFITADICSKLAPGGQSKSNGNHQVDVAVANLSVVPVEQSKFCLYNQAPVNLLADIQGCFAPSTTAGQLFVPSPPTRKLDTRIAPLTTPPVGAITKVSTGVAAGTSAVLVNLAMVDGAGPGFITADKCSVLKPGAQSRSSGNHTTTIAISNLAVVPVDPDGTFCIFNQQSVDLVVDLQGTFAPPTPAALGFTGTAPLRVLDTRVAPSTHPAPGTITRVSTGAAAGTAAVLVNLTMVGGAAPGFVTADACSSLKAGLQTKSSGNHAAGSANANLAVVPVDADGSFCIFNQQAVDVVVDLQGTFSTSGTQRFFPSTSIRVLDTR